MKRWMATCALALGLAACGGDEAPATDDESAFGKPDETTGDELAPAPAGPDPGLAPPEDPHLPFR